MRIHKSIRLRIRSLFRRNRVEEELDAEMRDHLERQIQVHVSAGMSPGDARNAALREFGNVALIQEQCRDTRRVNYIEDIFRDIRYALRSMRRNPAFSVTVLLTLGLGIGANTAVFSVVNRVLIQPLPYPDSDRLVTLTNTAAQGLASPTGVLPLSASMYFTFAEENRSFEELGIYTIDQAAVTDLDQPEQVRTMLVSNGTLQALGIQPEMGRWLEAEDQAYGGPERAMLSFGFWQRKFGGDASVIGSELIVDGRPREIVGVMARGFDIMDEHPELILPFAFRRSELVLANFYLSAVGRLKLDVTQEEASADLARLIPVWLNSWPAFEGSDPSVYEAWQLSPRLRPLKDSVVGEAGSTLWIVMVSLGIVMVIICANVANLLLVRAEARRGEFSTRAALGANRSQLVRGLLLESLVLGGLGGLLGMGVAYFSLDWLLWFGPESLPRLSETRLDGWGLAFVTGISMLSGLLIGAIPAIQYGKHLTAGTGGSRRGTTQSRERQRVRQTLVVAQVALALVLLVCSGLMVRTSLALLEIEPGVTDPATLQTLRVTIPASQVRDARPVALMQQAMLDAMAAIPGVDRAAFVNQPPLNGLANWNPLIPEGQLLREGEPLPLRMYQYVSPGYFQTAGTRLVAGRDYTWTDVYQQRPVVMLSENLAREFWLDPHGAVGKHVRAAPGRPLREVIGVVEDVRLDGIAQAPPTTVYWPTFGESPFFAGQEDIVRSVTFVLRSERSGTRAFLGELQEAVWSVNAELPLTSVETVEAIYDRSMARTAFATVIMGIAGAMALLLGIVGIYGVLSYTVSQRRREVGIRIALGAEPGRVRRVIMRQALMLTVTGVAIGLGAAFGMSEFMTSLLFGVSPADTVTYVGVSVVLLIAALAASYLPARRAAGVDPVEVLRAE